MLDDFQAAVNLNAKYADACSNLGMAQAALGQEEAVEASLRRALEIDPRHRDATTRLSGLLAAQGREKARTILEEALKTAPCTELYTALGNLLLAAGDADGAARQFVLLSRYDPLMLLRISTWGRRSKNCTIRPGPRSTSPAPRSCGQTSRCGGWRGDLRAGGVSECARE